jgi:hypothetical protein
MGMTFDPIALATKLLAKMNALSLDPSAGCLISSGVRAAKESFDVVRRHDLKSGERVQRFPCKTEHGTTVFIPRANKQLRRVLESDSGWCPIDPVARFWS